MRISLDGLLRSLGYRTAPFENAETFLVSGGARLADCVISDVAIPGGMSGLELARRLADECPDIPVILVSGFVNKRSREEAEGVGVALLAKPFDDEMLKYRRPTASS